MRSVKHSETHTSGIPGRAQGPGCQSCQAPHCCCCTWLRAYLIWRPLRTARMTFRRCRPSWNVCKAASRADAVTHGQARAQVADAASCLRGRMRACKTRAEPTLAEDAREGDGRPGLSCQHGCVPVDCHKALCNRWAHQETLHGPSCFALTSLLHTAQLRCTNNCCPSATPSFSGPTRSPSVPCRCPFPWPHRAHVGLPSIPACLQPGS